MGVPADQGLGEESYNELRMTVAVELEETDAIEAFYRLEFWRLAAWISSGKRGTGERYDRAYFGRRASEEWASAARIFIPR